MLNTVGGIFHCWWDHSAFDSSLHLSTLTEKLRSSHWRCSVGKGVLRNFAKLQGNTCARVSFSIKLQAKAWYFIKKEAPTQMFSCEFCETSKNTFFTPFSDIFRGYIERDQCHYVGWEAFKICIDTIQQSCERLMNFDLIFSYWNLNWLVFIKELVPKHVFVKCV